jgi:iron complex transport system substrate-binding protein
MKKSGLILVPLLLLSLLLAACGDASTSTSAPTTAVATTSAATTAAASTTSAAVTTNVAGSDLSFTDKTGYKGTLPKKAERIVCMWTDCLDILNVLGIEPLAVEATVYNIVAAASYPLVDKTKNTTKIGGTFAEPSVEEIFKLQPDLVVGFATVHKGLREVFKSGPPLYLIQGQSYGEMIENLRTFGRLTGKEDVAQKAIEKFQVKLNAYKAASPKTKSVMLMSSGDGNTIFSSTEKAVTCGLLNELSKCGWSTFPGFKETNPGSLSLTLEQIVAADPDVIISYIYPGRPTIAQTYKDNALWKELKAFKNKQIFEVDAAIIQPGGTYGLTVMLDTVMPLLYPEVFPKALP